MKFEISEEQSYILIGACVERIGALHRMEWEFPLERDFFRKERDELHNIVRILYDEGEL